MTKSCAIGLVMVWSLSFSAHLLKAFDCHDIPDAMFCDDFDRYCTPKPGYLEKCASDPNISTPNGGAMKAVWVRTSHGGAGNALCGGSVEIVPSNDVLKWGITSPPYAVREYSGGDEGGSYGQHTVDLRGRINNKWGSQYGSMSGTDANPLVLSFQIGGGIQNNFAAPYEVNYMELSYDDFDSAGDPYDANHRAPMDYVWVGYELNGCTSCRNLCEFLGFPDTGRPGQLVTACRFYEARGWTYDWVNEQQIPIPGVITPCPPLNSKIHTTLAVGFNAWLDPDPCHCSGEGFDDPSVGMMPRVTQNWRLSYFDGRAWRVLRTAGTDPNRPGTFMLGRKTNRVTMWVKGSTVDIQLFTKQDAETGDTMTSFISGLPRKYLNGFNVLRMGAGTGCNLHRDRYACDGNVHCTRNKIEHCGIDCQTLEPGVCNGGAMCCNIDTLANNIVYDDVLLDGGVPWSAEGACCKSDTSCEMLLSGTCASIGGHWTGAGQSCANTNCCPKVYGDSNLDGSVDMVDFGIMQQCLTTGSPTMSAHGPCLCFDADGDGKVGSTADIEQFIHCAKGPSIPGECTGKGW